MKGLLTASNIKLRFSMKGLKSPGQSAAFAAVIAIGFETRPDKANPKTGEAIQIYSIRADMLPLDAVQTGQDKAICFDCPLRGDNGYSGRTCYVNLSNGVRSVYQSFLDGQYPYLPESDYAKAFSGRFVRFGAYGEPVLLGQHKTALIASLCSGWTGYTHQWKASWASWAKPYFMASCSPHADWTADKAIANGWRAFDVRPEGKPCPTGLIDCPAYSRGIQCNKCKLCSGTSKRAKSISIPAHGILASNLTKNQ